MIDTIRFRTKVSEATYKAIQHDGIELEKRDNASRTTIFRVLRNDLPIGSHSRTVNIYVNEERECTVEFSVPKFAMGHNIFLVAPEELTSILEKLWRLLRERYKGFPDVPLWEIMRADLCYAWKLRNHDVAARVMEALQKLEVPRKKKSLYASSVMFIAPTTSIKFYLKDDEFYAHDFKELKRLGYFEEAYDLLKKSEGVLRFEITIRKKQLDRVLPYYSLFSTEAIEEILKKTLLSVLKGAGEANTLDDVANKLVEKHGNTRGFHLYSFWKVYYGEPNGRTKLKRYLHRSSISRCLSQLRQARVGLPTASKQPDDFNISIPSPYVVNDLGPPATAGGCPVVVTPDKRLKNKT